MRKKEIIGFLIAFFLVLITFLLMYFGGWRFLIVSFVFYAIGGAAEFIIKQKFYAKEKKIKPSCYLGFLWVHGIIHYIKKYGTEIYNYDKLGLLPVFTAYFIMFLYVLISFILFNLYGDYGFIIYLIPILTNIYFFWKHSYFIFR